MTAPTSLKAKATPRLRVSHVHAAGLVGVLTLAGVGYAFGYLPSAKAQAEAEAQQQAILRTREQADALATQLGQARAELQSLRASGHVPSTEPEGFTDVISETLRTNALASRDIVAGRPANEGSLQRVPIEVRATGQFSDIMAWLGDLRTQGPAFAIESVSLMAQPVDESSLMVQASLSAYAPHPAPSSGKEDASSSDAQDRFAPDR